MIDEVQSYVQDQEHQLAGTSAQPPPPPMPRPQPAAPAPAPAPAPDQGQQAIDLLNQHLGETPQPQPAAGEQPVDFDTAIKQLTDRLNRPEGPSLPMVQTEEQRAASIRHGYEDLYSGNNPPNTDPNDPNKLYPLRPDITALYGGKTPEAGPKEFTDQSNLGRAWRRMFGTDVDDPLQWTRTGTTLTGAVGGGSIGAGLPGPPIVRAAGAMVGGFIGGVAGAAAPEITLQTLEDLGFLKPGTRKRMGLSDADLEQVIEGEALLDIYTMGGVSAVRGAARGITNVITGSSAATKAMAEAGTREGIALMPVQVGNSQFARSFVSVMGHFPLIAGPLRRQGEPAVQRIAAMFNGIPERLAPLSTFDDLSGAIMRDAQATTTAIATHYDGQINALLTQAGRQQLVARPVTTDTVTKGVLAEIDRLTPKAADGSNLPIPRELAQVRNFLQQTTSRFYDQAGQVADQNLRQLDTMMTMLNHQAARSAESGSTQAVQWIDRVRQALQSDMVTHVLQKSGNGYLPTSPAARQFMADFRQVDADMTQTVNELFANATASKVGITISPNQRAARFMADQQGRVDNIAKVIADSGSPDAIVELNRLASRDTMQRFGSAYLNQAITAGNTERAGNVIFDVDKFAANLGLNDRQGLKYAQTQRVLQATNGLNMDQLENFVSMARAADRVTLPNVSSFVARRAVFEGLPAVVKTFVPGAAIMGGSAYAGGLTGLVTIYGGSRLISSMISNPISARALTAVMDTEASNVVRRAAMMRAVVSASGNLVRDGWKELDIRNMLSNINASFTEFDKQVKQEQRK